MTGEEQVATPEVVSVQLNVTVTSELFHPFILGGGDCDALIDGAVLSMFTVTLVVVLLPAASVAVTSMT